MDVYRDVSSKQEDVLSINLLNQISEEIIAKVHSKDELYEVVDRQVLEQYARTEGWKRAYKEIPLPSNSVPLEKRKDLQDRRNDLAEWYYLEIMEKFE